MSNEEKNCADKVADAWASRREDLEMMLDPQPEYLTINDESPAEPNDGWVIGYGETSFRDYIEPDKLFDECEDAIREAGREAFNEYGLAFDYVAPYTFHDQPAGYWRYQISYGGPSEELRFYADADYEVRKIEFWYLDWYDGACVNVTSDTVAQAVWDEFNECETTRHVFKEAMNDE